MTATTRSAGFDRRSFLTGTAGLAGALAFPGALTACGQDGSSGSGSGPGTVKFASTWQGDAPALQTVVDSFVEQTDVTVNINEVDPQTFSDQIDSYLQATPDDVFTWFGGYRMRYYADLGLVHDISDAWDNIGGNFSEAFQTASTGADGKPYLVPFYNYPWVVIYRQSVFDEHGYQVPETLSDTIALAETMQSDGLVPFAFADQDGWPAQGWFDIINMRLNGYQFHIDLLAGNERWTDSRVAGVFDAWREFLPYCGDISAALGRTWQDGANLLFNGEAGMLFFGTFAGTQTEDPEIREDIDFFAFPTLETEFDDENAIDAPINGFLVSANSPTLEENMEAVNAFVEHLGSGEAQGQFLSENPNFVAAANDVDTSVYTPFQEKMAEVIDGAGAVAQFLDRDTDPAFAGEMESILQNWLNDPEQDTDSFLSGIQDFWDTLDL